MHVPRMYIVEGINHQGQPSKPLKYATLDEAMTKLRDLAEADEADSGPGGEGPMFIAYTLRIEPLPEGPRNTDPTPTPAPETRAAWRPRLAGE